LGQKASSVTFLPLQVSDKQRRHGLGVH
jgi:hypothetical protein